MRISMTKPRGASSLSRRDDNKRIGTAEAALTGGLFSFKPFATKIDHSGYFRCSPKSGSTADIGGGPVRANRRHPDADRLNKSRPWAALNSILSIGDQAVIKAGFGFRRWAALADNDF